MGIGEVWTQLKLLNFFPLDPLNSVMAEYMQVTPHSFVIIRRFLWHLKQLRRSSMMSLMGHHYNIVLFMFKNFILMFSVEINLWIYR